VRIAEISSVVVSIPLRRPVRVATRPISARAYTIARVVAEDGRVGVGFTVGGRPVQAVVEDILAPALVGRPALAIEEHWQTMFRACLQIGRHGIAMRAISIVDVALWDLKGQLLGQPIAALLGGGRACVPVYASGGYYREGAGPAELAEEVRGYLDQGFRAVKIRLGGLRPADDLARIEAVRCAVGPDVDVMVDVNHAWDDPALALPMLRALEPYNVRWVEEPVLPDNIEQSTRLAASTDIPIAAGEIESTRWAFRELIERRAVDIVQPDVSVVGGISEWMKVAALAGAAGVPIAPHYVWEVHAHLAAAVPGVCFVEYFTRESDVVGFDDLLREPLRPVDGFLPVPCAPGLGVALDDDAVDRHRVA
jgi:D-arabinonate dehydratase